ncbi:MAG: hypothetical protein ACUVQG_01750, partial [Thermogutta sp.]
LVIAGSFGVTQLQIVILPPSATPVNTYKPWVCPLRCSDGGCSPPAYAGGSVAAHRQLMLAAPEPRT